MPTGLIQPLAHAKQADNVRPNVALDILPFLKEGDPYGAQARH